MATRTVQMLVATAALWAAGPASAKVYLEARPRATLTAGYDDNVLLGANNNVDGDSFGQATPGLTLELFGDHELHGVLDCQAGFARLAHPDRFQSSSVSGSFASNLSCNANYKDRLSTRTTMSWRARATYAQDPFALAGYGLLLRPGQTRIFAARLYGEVQHALSTRTSVELGLGADALDFGSGEPDNGFVVAPQARYLLRTSERATWDLGAREQLFFAIGAQGVVSPDPAKARRFQQGGLISEGHAALAGWTYRLSEVATFRAHGGAVLVTGSNGSAVVPSARVELEAATPKEAARLEVAHDLIIGSSAAGPVAGDMVELLLTASRGPFDGGLRAGIYRNSSAYVLTQLGYVGYSAGCSLDWRFTREWKLGVAALRDARLSDLNVGQPVDRDVFQVRLTWERARFN